MSHIILCEKEDLNHQLTWKLLQRINSHITNTDVLMVFGPVYSWRSHLGQMYRVPQTPQQWPSPWGQWCSRSETPGPRWQPWAGRWWWWRQWSKPSHSGSLWEGRKQTGPSRRQWGSAWRSRNRTVAVLLPCLPRPHLLGRRGAERVGKWQRELPEDVRKEEVREESIEQQRG